MPSQAREPCEFLFMTPLLAYSPRLCAGDSTAAISGTFITRGNDVNESGNWKYDRSPESQGEAVNCGLSIDHNAVCGGPEPSFNCWCNRGTTVFCATLPDVFTIGTIFCHFSFDPHHLSHDGVPRSSKWGENTTSTQKSKS